jgi:menaquinone-dependent protoporphyrinogen oxidase
MNIKIIYATRYGSSAEISGWIAQRLRAEKGIRVDIERADIVVSSEGYDLVLLGSGIYNHGFLPELEEYIDTNLKNLKKVKTALFGVAMKTEPVLVNGKAFGGILMLEKYAEKLGKWCMKGAMLHGEMVYSVMSDKDRLGIDKFYKMIGLSKEQIAERKSPRTLMKKAEAWEFAENILRDLR